MIQIVPSVFAADYYRLGEQMEIMEEEGIGTLHLDVMDGSFVPGFSFGPDFIGKLRPHSRQVFDVHLMAERPWRLIGDCVSAGADAITLHLEAFSDEERLLEAVEQVHGLGKRAGIAVNPGTEVLRITERLWLECDMVQIMTTEPGRKGQRFMAESLRRIEQARKKAKRLRRNVPIQADGDINLQNIFQVTGAGAESLVVGKGLFSGNLRENIRAFQAAIRGAEPPCLKTGPDTEEGKDG